MTEPINPDYLDTEQATLEALKTLLFSGFMEKEFSATEPFNDLKLGRVHEEAAALAGVMTQNYITTIDQTPMDQRLSRALEAYGSAASEYEETTDWGDPAHVFSFMEHLSSLHKIIIELKDPAIHEHLKAPSSYHDECFQFEELLTYIDMKVRCLSRWLSHLSTCDDCHSGERAPSVVPPTHGEDLMDEIGYQTATDQAGSGGGQEEGGLQIEDVTREEAPSTREEAERRYAELICPKSQERELIKQFSVQDFSIQSLMETGFGEALPSDVYDLLTAEESPLESLLAEAAERAGDFYIRVRLTGFESFPIRDGDVEMAAFISDREDLRGAALEKLSNEVGGKFADHIRESVHPYLGPGDPKRVLFEVETVVDGGDEALFHYALDLE
jgi:hypothetical protein